MKTILKRILTTLVIFAITTVTIYSAFTIKEFFDWGNKNQLFINYENIIEELDSKRIEEIGGTVSSYEQALKDSLTDEIEERDEKHPLLAEYYEPLGLSVWMYLHINIYNIPTANVNISIIIGITITMAYLLITSKKINNVLKFIIGYLGAMAIVPQILWYASFRKLFNILLPYYKAPKVIYFYIVYTIIFILIYIVNYRIGSKMAKELNKTIEKNT